MTEAYEHKARKSNANEAKGHRENVKIPLLFFVVDPASDWSPDSELRVALLRVFLIWLATMSANDDLEYWLIRIASSVTAVDVSVVFIPV